MGANIEDYDWEDDSHKCYALWMQVRKEGLKERCPRCGCSPLQLNEIHGHVSCYNCGSILESCCGE